MILKYSIDITVSHLLSHIMLIILYYSSVT